MVYKFTKKKKSKGSLGAARDFDRCFTYIQYYSERCTRLWVILRFISHVGYLASWLAAFMLNYSHNYR